MFCNCGLYVRVYDDCGATCPECGRFVSSKMGRAKPASEPKPVSWTVLTFYDLLDERGIVRTPKFDQTFESSAKAYAFAKDYESAHPLNSARVVPNY